MNVTISLSPEEFAALEQLASDQGQELSSYLRDLVVRGLPERMPQPVGREDLIKQLFAETDQKFGAALRNLAK